LTEDVFRALKAIRKYGSIEEFLSSRNPDPADSEFMYRQARRVFTHPHDIPPPAEKRVFSSQEVEQFISNHGLFDVNFGSSESSNKDPFLSVNPFSSS
jgi:hypothetical protein